MFENFFFLAGYKVYNSNDTCRNANCIFQISEEEISFLTEGEDPYDDNVVRKLYHPNLKLLLVTEGAEGCRYYTKVSPQLWLIFSHST